jgi:antitoxin ParD1/3/4
MTSMTVSLPDALGEWVQSRVAGGGYASISDYLRDLISRDQEAATNDMRWLADLDASVVRGVADSDAGRVFDAEEVFDELEAKYSAMVASPERR